MSLSVKPTVTASAAYSAGNVVGGLLQFTHIESADLMGILESLTLSVASVQTNTFKAYVFGDNPSASTFTDKTAPVINAADVPKLLGVYQFPTGDSGLGTHTIYQIDAIAKLLQLATRTMFVVLVCTGAVTFTTTSDVTLTAGVIGD